MNNKDLDLLKEAYEKVQLNEIGTPDMLGELGGVTCKKIETPEEFVEFSKGTKWLSNSYHAAKGLLERETFYKIIINNQKYILEIFDQGKHYERLWVYDTDSKSINPKKFLSNLEQKGISLSEFLTPKSVEYYTKEQAPDKE